MSVQTQALRGASAGGLSDYFENDVEGVSLGRYLGSDQTTPARGVSGEGKVIFGANQITGRAAARMGLEAGLALDLGGMERLIDGRQLATGERLVKPRGAPVYERDDQGRYRYDDDGNKIRKLDADGKPVIDHSRALQGTQVVTAPPKSVGVAMILAAAHNPAMVNALLAAHEGANAELMSWIEDNVALGKRTIKTPTEVSELAGGGGPTIRVGPRAGRASKMQGSRTERTTVDLAVFSVTQFTARPTPERPLGDPLPHTHNMIAKAAYDPVTERWGTIDEYALKEAVMATRASAVYGAALHRRLVDLGFETEAESFDGDRAGRLNWRIKGVSLEAERFFSTNHERMGTLVAEWESATGRIASPAMVNKLLRDTKSPKTPESKIQDTRPDWAHWGDMASGAGVDLGTEDLVNTIKAQSPRVVRETYQVRHDTLQERLAGPNGLVWKAASFTHHEAMSSLARCAEGLDFTPDEMATIELEVLEATVALDPIAADGSPRDPRYVQRTTQTQLDTETGLDAALELTASRSYQPASPEALQAALGGLDQNLDLEQLAVVDAISSSRGVTFVEGFAGTGKTTALRPAVAALRASGAVDKVIVVSTSSLTGRNTGAKLNADFSGSVDALVAATSAGRIKLDDRSLVIYDEAFMADTARAARLVEAMGTARVVFVGDPEQAQPIGAAGWYHDATARHGVTGRLTHVHRQVDVEDRAALLALREGRATDALNNFEQRGRLHVRSDAQDAFETVGETYASYRDSGLADDQVRVISAGGSNAANDRVNRLIQSERLARSEISTEHLTVHETTTQRTWKLHTGDPVLFLTSYRTDQDRIANGTSARVEHIDSKTMAALVRTTEGTLVNVALSEHSDHQIISPAYAVHSQKYQGAETSVVLVVVPEPSAVNKFAFYSAASRATNEVHVFVDRETHGESPKASLAEHLGGSPFPQSASAIQSGGQRNTYTAIKTQLRVDQDNQTKKASDFSAKLSPAPRVDHNARSLARDSARRAHLARIIGPEVAGVVSSSPSYPQLRVDLNSLETQGYNASKMLANATRNTDLTTNGDAAAVLSAQLNNEPRIIRNRPAVPEALEVPTLSLPVNQDAIELRERLEAAREQAQQRQLEHRTPTLGI